MDCSTYRKKRVSPPEYDIQDMVDDAINVIHASSYIARNRAYLDKISRVKFVYSEEMIANSFAARTGIDSYGVYTFEGLSLLLCTCAAVFSEFTSNHNAAQAKKALKWLFGHVFTEIFAYGDEWDAILPEKIDAFYRRFPEYLVKENYPRYMELARKMITFVLGHEIGHIMLCHCDRTNGKMNNVSRNNERSADLFSCSILQGTGFGSSFAEGAIFLILSFYFMDTKKTRNLQYGTHPGHTDRVMNIIQSFKNELRFANISEADILYLMK